jgi:DNA-binding LacI/PurR family transcriptional regulator
LAQRRASTAGVIIHELASPILAPMISEIEGVAKRESLVVIGETAREETLERRYVERFQQLCVAGVIVDPASRKMSHLERVRTEGAPR